MACGSVRISVSKRAIDNKCGPHSGPYVTVQVEAIDNKWSAQRTLRYCSGRGVACPGGGVDGRSRGVLYGEETKVWHVMRGKLILFGIQEWKHY